MTDSKNFEETMKSPDEIETAEQHLKAKAAEFERTLDHLTQKMQEGADFVKKFREDTHQFAETVRSPGAVLQPYLEKGLELAEEYVQNYLQGKKSNFETYVNEAAETLEHGTDRILNKMSEAIKTGIEKMEARPIIPGVALFLGGFILGGLMIRQSRTRPVALRRIQGGIASPAFSSSPSGSAG